MSRAAVDPRHPPAPPPPNTEVHPSLRVQEGEKLQQGIFGEPHDDELVADALWATQAENRTLNVGVTQTHWKSH